MKLETLRQTFLEYFADKGHTVVPSSSIVPGNDKTLLFTNAGMVQFKDTFTGSEKREYTRATSSQCCIRAGGKHNDLENVGYTARHHTFFEMLGNFSFGDYFKEEAIKFSWELINERLKLPTEKLWVTVFEEDDEAYDIWAKTIGFPEDRISRIGAKDNFWQMGDTGPCGPCTEIFYDHGEEVWGGPPGTPEEEGDRFVEFWNLVFMQYNRQSDGVLEPLPRPSVDTGMGLERMAAILQNVHSNYEIDLFVSLIDAVQKATGAKDKTDNSLKVIADHIRAISFLIKDGVLPSNEGRGYVLRRIIRRAARHGHKLGQEKPFIYTLLHTLQVEMGDTYPELREKGELITQTILDEENRFVKTLDDGMKILQADLKSGGLLSGDIAFKLYDTYGFPIDLTLDVAREHEMKVDMDRYDILLANQKAKSQSASSFKSQATLSTDKETNFTGYSDEQTSTSVAQLFVNSKSTDSITKGQQAIVVLAASPFFGESGGQVGDIGTLKTDTATFTVSDTQKQGNTFLHIGEVSEGTLKIGDSLHAEIDSERRKNIQRNHSATHLLHHALREVLGKTVEQKGSLVSPERLRFDFTHNKPVTADELCEVTSVANLMVLENNEVSSESMSIDDAKEKGAMALFGEKYGDVVRVVEMGESIELCGGTHSPRTGDIGQVVITSESGVSSGVRRIEAITGEFALKYHAQHRDLLDTVSAGLGTTRDNLPTRVTKLQGEIKALNKQIKELQKALTSGQAQDSSVDIFEISGIKYLTSIVTGYDSNALRDLADQLRDKHELDLVVLGCEEEGKAKLVATVNKTSCKNLHAGNIVKALAEVVDGRGGGRPDFAQAGGSSPEKLSDIADAVKKILST